MEHRDKQFVEIGFHIMHNDERRLPQPTGAWFSCD